MFVGTDNIPHDYSLVYPKFGLVDIQCSDQRQ